MKRVFGFGLAALFAVMLAAPTAANVRLGVAQDDDSPSWAPYVGDAIHNGIAAAKEQKDLSGYGPAQAGSCLVGGFVDVGKTFSYTFTLREKRDYIFIGAGDRDVTELEIEAYADKESVGKSDNGPTKTPVLCLEVTDEYQTKLTLRLKKGAAQKGYRYFVLMIVLESKAGKGSLEGLKNGAKIMNTACGKLEKDSDLVLDDEGSAPCMVAQFFTKTGTRSLWRTFEKGSTYVVLSAGDSHCKGLTVELQDYDSKESIQKADKPDSASAVGWVCDRGKAWVKLDLSESDDPTFVITVILKKK